MRPEAESGAARPGAVLARSDAMRLELTPSEALDLWRQVLVASVRQAGPDLSARQLALVLTVYMTPAPHTVRGLAAFLRISKPAVTRALDRLGKLGIVRRKVDQTEHRRADPALIEGGEKVLLDEVAAAPDIDHRGAARHESEGAAVEDALGLGGERHKADEDVAAREQRRKARLAVEAGDPLDALRP